MSRKWMSVNRGAETAPSISCPFGGENVVNRHPVFVSRARGMLRIVLVG